MSIVARDFHRSMPPLVAPTVWLLDSRPIFSARIQHPERLGPASPPRTLIISFYSSAPTICPTWLVYPWPFLPDTASSCLCSGDAVHLAGPKATALAGIPHRGPARREHPPPSVALSASEPLPGLPGPPSAAVPPVCPVAGGRCGAGALLPTHLPF